MPKIKVITSALVVAIGLALFGCGPATPAPTKPRPIMRSTEGIWTSEANPATPTPTKPRPIILTVLHTNDTAGFTDPCG